MRIVNTLNSSKLVKMITDFLSSKVVEGQKQSNKLRDLELSLIYEKDVHNILEALSDNYMIKTVRLKCQTKKVDAEIQELAQQFKSKRVGTEVMISCNNTDPKNAKLSSIEVFYPDAF